ncbi:lysine N(6)-hydroxylase/L-ornithine N(5)-oxygenase family protein [Rhodococcus artemisiae]|uniref:L-lysine N6-monooxygenase MbtG n=1 Tax=Rhodococcus artemisiae TaxID=714159 RepID=A0ABU7LCD4_9NOCA|nr:SidA/IucD/PvdA family monooxygenase [Rhodococcus artemisiae]MEE2058927.1 SidA/IucD/PvdA family monooxygenase [Rhodococcus artemisiae]
MIDRSSTFTGQSEVQGDPHGEVFDLVGIGFGPANLALAIAIEEHNETSPGNEVRACFLERRTEFGWHPGMLLEGSTMQIAFPKDLVTFRNPTSSYSFFSYLHEHDRLVDFVNHQTFFPTRLEFQDYLQWAARRVGTDVRYGTDIVSVEALHNARGSADLFAIRSADGSVVHARTVVMGVGLRARVPGWATESARCFHNHDFLFHLEEMPSPVHQRFVVVGAGQSAAEVVQYLHTNYPQAEVHNVFGRFGYSPADDSPYANRIFDPAVVDELHAAPLEERERLLALHKSTNYTVVAPELIEALYAAEYRERVRGPRRLFMRRASEVLATEETSAGIDVEIRNNLDGLSDTLKCDAVVLATGFEPASLGSILGDLAWDTPVPPVARDYRLDLPADVAADVYLLGGTEKTHGLTASLLSNAAVRAGEVLSSVLERRLRKQSVERAEQSVEHAGTGELDRIPNQHTYATSEAR